MRRTGFIILLSVLVLLGGYYLYLARHRPVILIAGPIYSNLQTVGPVTKDTTRSELSKIVGQPSIPRDEPGEGLGLYQLTPREHDYYDCLNAEVSWDSKDKPASITYRLDRLEKSGFDARIVLFTDNTRSAVLSRDLRIAEASSRAWLSELGIDPTQIKKNKAMLFIKFPSGGAIYMLFDTYRGGRLVAVEYLFPSIPRRDSK